MAVFRVERTAGYTVMSNHHLRNKDLSLKAKGLLSQMLSLPEDWDFTIARLSYINREKIDAIHEAIRELEKAGYVIRTRERDDKGRWGNADDIAPYIDPVFENNVLLTNTERRMMSSRPSHPKYARNKNVIVVGGSGSGKTRFYVKPNLMQMHSNYVVTDPKGYTISR